MHACARSMPGLFIDAAIGTGRKMHVENATCIQKPLVTQLGLRPAQADGQNSPGCTLYHKHGVVGVVLSAYSSPRPKRHRFSRFCETHVSYNQDRPTNRPCCYFCSNRPHLASAAISLIVGLMWCKKTRHWLFWETVPQYSFLYLWQHLTDLRQFRHQNQSL